MRVFSDDDSNEKRVRLQYYIPGNDNCACMYLHTYLAAAASAQPGPRQSLNIIFILSFHHRSLQSRDGVIIEQASERGKVWQDLYDVEIFPSRELTLKSSPVSPPPPPQLKPPFHA